MFKNDKKLFQLYAGQPHASNLSIAGGAVKLLALLLMVAALPTTLALLLSIFRIAMAGGLGTALIFLMDELDEEFFMAVCLWGAVLMSYYVANVLQAKAKMLAQHKQLESAAQQPGQESTSL